MEGDERVDVDFVVFVSLLLSLWENEKHLMAFIALCNLCLKLGQIHELQDSKQIHIEIIQVNPYNRLKKREKIKKMEEHELNKMENRAQLLVSTAVI